MAWTAPPVFVSGAGLTAPQLNVLSGDLNETAPAKATAAGQWFVASGSNSLVARSPAAGNVTGGAQGTPSLSYVDLTTIGPACTTTTGTAAIVGLSADLYSDTAGGYAEMAWQCSGATALSAGAYAGLRTITESFAGALASMSKVNYVTTLNSGSNTFKALYRALNTGTAIFNHREIFVIPIN